MDYAYFAIFGIILVLFVTGQFSQQTGFTLVVIDNPDPNSMFPTYFQGDLFMLQKGSPENIELGDVIVYETTAQKRIIHRVIDVVNIRDDWFYRVKGDNPVTNYNVDPYSSGSLIPFDAVLGKVIARIPHIGHISLTMQQNTGIRILVYFLAGALIVAIIFWPEKKDEEEEEEDKYFDISLTSLRTVVINFSVLLGGFHSALFKSKYKIMNWLITILLVVFLVIPLFLPGLLPYTYSSDQIGIIDVQVGDLDILQESGRNDYNAVFLNTSVVIQDQTSAWNKIRGFTMYVYEDFSNSSSLVSQTEWTTRRMMKGQFTVGGSIMIDIDIANNVGITNMTVVVELYVRSGFQTDTLEPFTTDFLFNINNP